MTPRNSPVPLKLKSECQNVFKAVFKVVFDLLFAFALCILLFAKKENAISKKQKAKNKKAKSKNEKAKSRREFEIRIHVNCLYKKNGWNRGASKANTTLNTALKTF